MRMKKLRPTRDPHIMIIVICRGFDSDYYQNHLRNKLELLYYPLKTLELPIRIIRIALVTS